MWDGQVHAVPPSTTGSTWYVDGKGGSDGNAGTSASAAFKTIAKAITKIAAGDTVLIKGGIYHEGIVLIGSPSGSAGKPITFGSLGDSEVILDGSTQVAGWTRCTSANANCAGATGQSTVWYASWPDSYAPVAVVVNEVPLKQINTGQVTEAPVVAVNTLASGSGGWGWDATNKIIYADMGSVTPASADIVIPNARGDQTHVYFYAPVSYINLIGLTIRGSGAGGFWTDGGVNNITVEFCNFKFNGKCGFSFGGGADNHVFYSHVYQNMITNWPRGNNDWALDGGGWAGGAGWSGEIRAVAIGVISHENGGEGIINYGYDQRGGVETGNGLFVNNISFDNWSVNLYVDNNPNNVIHDNTSSATRPTPQSSSFGQLHVELLFGEVPDLRVAFGRGRQRPDRRRRRPCRKHALYNNLMFGCRYGFADGSEDVTRHGIKNTLIANNTIVGDSYVYTQEDSAAMLIGNNGTNNKCSFIENNLIHANTGGNAILGYGGTIAVQGVTMGHNLYFSPAANAFVDNWGTNNTSVNFTAYQSVIGQDSTSRFLDPNSSMSATSGKRRVQLGLWGTGRRLACQGKRYRSIELRDGLPRRKPWSKLDHRCIPVVRRTHDHYLFSNPVASGVLPVRRHHARGMLELVHRES